MILLTAFALATASTPMVAATPDPFTLIELAIARNRLIQAGEMIRLARRKPSSGTTDQLDLLEGQLSLLLGHNGNAFSLFSRVEKSAPKNCEASEGAGIAALRLNRINAARTRLLDAAAQCPDRWRTWNAIAIIADRNRQWRESAIAYDRARTIAPREASIINNLGYSLILQRRFAEAEQVLRDGLRILPDDQRLQNNLDIALAANDQPILNTDSDGSTERYAIRLSNAGYISYVLGNTAQSRDLYEKSQNAGSHTPKSLIENIKLLQGQ
jgi:Tfp pilus assembly protein PilF